MRDHSRRNGRYAACVSIAWLARNRQAVTVGLGRRTKREAAELALKREAAEIIDRRIADGRPPPEVWRAAAARQAKRGLPADAWYRPADAPAPDRRVAAPRAGGLAPTVGSDLVLRVVQLPLEPSSVPAPGRGASFPRAVAGASN